MRGLYLHCKKSGQKSERGRRLDIKTLASVDMYRSAGSIFCGQARSRSCDLGWEPIQIENIFVPVSRSCQEKILQPSTEIIVSASARKKCVRLLEKSHRRRRPKNRSHLTHPHGRTTCLLQVSQTPQQTRIRNKEWELGRHKTGRRAQE